MRILVTLSLVLAACGGSAKSTGVTETNDTAVETCCCKSHPQTSEDGQAVYEVGNVMECSAKQGECVDEVQCQQQPQPE